jgi:hypothetical protein
MKQKVISAVIYAVTTLALAAFFDGLYGGESLTRHLVLIHVATAGAVLFAVACVSCIFSPRFGIVCALAACILSWPFFSGNLFAILKVWRSLFSVVHYSNWGDSLAAVVTLIISSIYSLSRLPLLFQPPGTAK